MCDLLIKPLLIFFAKIVQTESNKNKLACFYYRGAAYLYIKNNKNPHVACAKIWNLKLRS